MLQYNTPNGLYTVRRKECHQGLISALWDLLPAIVCKHRVNHHCVEEIMDFMRGRIKMPIRNILQLLEISSDRADFLVSYEEAIVSERMVTIICTTGTIPYSLDNLRRRFQLVDDYFSEYPDATEINVPYDLGTLMACLRWTLGTLLNRCHPCIAYLNPKSNLYPFYFSPRRAPLALLETLAARLTPEERKALEAYGDRMSVALPKKDGVCLLAVLEHFRADLDIMRGLFPEYPSYAFCACASYHKDRNHGLYELVVPLLTWDFSADKDNFIFEYGEVMAIVEAVVASVNDEDLTERQIRQAARMIASTDSLSDVTVMAPYDVDCCLSDRAEENRKVFAKMLEFASIPSLALLRHELDSI